MVLKLHHITLVLTVVQVVALIKAVLQEFLHQLHLQYKVMQVE